MFSDLSQKGWGMTPDILDALHKCSMSLRKMELGVSNRLYGPWLECDILCVSVWSIFKNLKIGFKSENVMEKVYGFTHSFTQVSRVWHGERAIR